MQPLQHQIIEYTIDFLGSIESLDVIPEIGQVVIFSAIRCYGPEITTHLLLQFLDEQGLLGLGRVSSHSANL